MCLQKRGESEAADPFLTTAIEAMRTCGTPPPRTVIGDPSQVVRTGAETVRWCCASLPSVGWTQDDTLGHDASRTKCHRAMSSLRAKATIIFLRQPFFLRASNHLAKALSFW